jgi:hypothetical protein
MLSINRAHFVAFLSLIEYVFELQILFCFLYFVFVFFVADWSFL